MTIRSFGRPGRATGRPCARARNPRSGRRIGGDAKTVAAADADPRLTGRHLAPLAPRAFFGPRDPVCRKPSTPYPRLLPGAPR
jgi:hypothetical protein